MDYKRLFSKPKNPKLAKAISITSPSAFNKSIKKVKGMSGFSETTKKRALVLAKNRAKVQLKRKNLSTKERKEFKKIASTKIPF